MGGSVRLRMIIMTAFTTTFALLPLATFAGQDGRIIGAELAGGVIGGPVSSTFLTLIVVPIIHTIGHQSISSAPSAPCWAAVGHAEQPTLPALRIDARSGRRLHDQIDSRVPRGNLAYSCHVMLSLRLSHSGQSQSPAIAQATPQPGPCQRQQTRRSYHRAER